MESWVQALYQCVLRFFHLICVKCCRSYHVLHLSRKIFLGNLKIWCSTMQPLSGHQRPDLLTSLMNMSLVLRIHAKCIFADPLEMSHAYHRFWKCYKTFTFLLTSGKVRLPWRLPRKTTSFKSGPSMWAFNISTWKCASRHNSVHFLNISTFKNATRMVQCEASYSYKLVYKPR